jgi:hypothetical protein
MQQIYTSMAIQQTPNPTHTQSSNKFQKPLGSNLVPHMHNTWWGFEPLPIKALPIAKQMIYTSKTHIGHMHTNRNVNHVHSQVCCHLVNVVYTHKHNKLTKVDFAKTNKPKISKDLNVPCS